MRRFRLMTSAGYSEFREGEVYDENFTPEDSDYSVIQLAHDYPEDWEEFFDEPKRLHKDTDLGYFAGVALQGFLANPLQDFVGMELEKMVNYCVDSAKELIKALDKEVDNV